MLVRRLREQGTGCRCWGSTLRQAAGRAVARYRQRLAAVSQRRDLHVLVCCCLEIFPYCQPRDCRSHFQCRIGVAYSSLRQSYARTSCRRRRGALCQAAGRAVARYRQLSIRQSTCSADVGHLHILAPDLKVLVLVQISNGCTEDEGCVSVRNASFCQSHCLPVCCCRK